MKNYFVGKVIIITGSSKGIGKALAKQLGTLGSKIVLNARNAEGLIEVVTEFRNQGIDCIGFEGDVSTEDACKEILRCTFETYGKIDALVNNVGIGMRSLIAKLRPSTITSIYHVNGLAPAILSQLALPYIIESKGSIVFISSLAGLRGVPFLSVYSAAKMSLTAFAQALRVEHHSDGIHVGLVYVGITQVEQGKTVFGSDGEQIPLELRKGPLIDSLDTVASKIVQNIYKRKKQTIVGIPGKLFYFFTKYFPAIFEYVLIKSQKRVNKLYK